MNNAVAVPGDLAENSEYNSKPGRFLENPLAKAHGEFRILGFEKSNVVATSDN